jgi:quercetin dioxygenase-like cupin family protein
MGYIDTDKFEKRATSEGYAVSPREVGPSEGLDDHTHDFDAWGLITAGEFHITVDGKTTVYATGDEFKLPAGCLHSEKAGPTGASFLAGRRMKP